MKTAEQWADELVERLNAESSHVWQSIMADVIREAMAVPSDAARLAVGSLLTKEDAVVLIGRAVSAEREACAALADHEAGTMDKMIPMCGQYKARMIAAQIRDRGKKCSFTPASPKTQSSTSNGAATS